MNLTEWPGEPESAASSEPATPGPAPWEDPERPHLLGYFQTLGEILRRPARFFARPARGGWGEPCAFGLITGTTGGLLGGVLAGAPAALRQPGVEAGRGVAPV